jgi:hypothetical protein
LAISGESRAKVPLARPKKSVVVAALRTTSISAAFNRGSGRELTTVLVAIGEIDRVITLHRKDDVANKRPVGKVTFDLCLYGAAFALDLQESTNAALE